MNRGVDLVVLVKNMYVFLFVLWSLSVMDLKPPTPLLHTVDP